MRFHKQPFRERPQKPGQRGVSAPARGERGVSAPARGQRGVSAMITIVVLVPVVFALIGFGLDLGILYSIKGELKTAANAAALAAAAQLIGTDEAGVAANAAAG